MRKKLARALSGRNPAPYTPHLLDMTPQSVRRYKAWGHLNVQPLSSYVETIASSGVAVYPIPIFAITIFPGAKKTKADPHRLTLRMNTAYLILGSGQTRRCTLIVRDAT